MQLISKIKVKEFYCSIISSFKSTSFDMFLTSSYSRRSTSRISALKSAKEVLIFQELCTVLCLNKTRMSIKLLNHSTVTAGFFEDVLAPLKRPLEAALAPILLSVTTTTCLPTAPPPPIAAARSRSLSTTHTHSKRCGLCWVV